VRADKQARRIISLDRKTFDRILDLADQLVGKDEAR
jgi:hypothetical protein